METFWNEWLKMSSAMFGLLLGIAFGIIIGLYALGFFDRGDDDDDR